jgi:hypothetical protein
MKLELNSMSSLKRTRDQISMEFISLDPAVGFLKNSIDGIISAFANTISAPDLPKITNLSRDQSKFLQVLKDIPFSEIGQLKAYVPEGMKSKYLDYLDTLLPVTDQFKDIQNKLLQPYTLFLAQLVSDKKASISTNANKIEYGKLESQRDAIYKSFSSHYNMDSYGAERLVKDVVDRNNDWGPVFNKLNICSANMDSIDKELIKRQVKQCVDYLSIIKENLDSEQMSRTTKETAERLSNGCYQIARELEMLSVTHYRVLALKGSVENTVLHITSVLG